MLDSVNLPADRDTLAEAIITARAAFDGVDGLDDPEFLFVLEDATTDQVIGVSMVFATHGTPERPHHYLRLEVDEHYSKTLGTLFRHQTLRFRLSYTPHTELGALVLEPAYRGHPARLGKLLSYARLLYIALRRDRFEDTVQAELLPPLEPDGSSRLWNWLGHRFTGLSYKHADRLSRDDHEFMSALFPQYPVYTALMPEEVQAMIGSVGPGTRNVARMLKAVGFRFNNHIDPFDGGPHYEANTDDVTIIAGTRRGTFLSERPDAEPLVGVVARAPDDNDGLRIASGAFSVSGDRIWVEDDVASGLGLSAGDPVAVAPYPPPVRAP